MTGRMMTSGMFSSSTDDWATPKHIFDQLNKEFGFTLDVCASDSNHKCARYFTVEEDGLKQPWGGNMLDESPLRGNDCKMDGKSVFPRTERWHLRVPRTRKDGHKMVEGLRYESK